MEKKERNRSSLFLPFFPLFQLNPTILCIVLIHTPARVYGDVYVWICDVWEIATFLRDTERGNKTVGSSHLFIYQGFQPNYTFILYFFFFPSIKSNLFFWKLKSFSFPCLFYLYNSIICLRVTFNIIMNFSYKYLLD